METKAVIGKEAAVTHVRGMVGLFMVWTMFMFVCVWT